MGATPCWPIIATEVVKIRYNSPSFNQRAASLYLAAPTISLRRQNASDQNSYRNRLADTCCIVDGVWHRYRIPNFHPSAHVHSLPDVHTSSNSDARANRNPASHIHSLPYPYRNPDGGANAKANRNAYPYPDSHAYAHADSHAYAHADSNSGTNAHQHSGSHSHAYA